MKKIGIIIGSLRKDSFARKWALELVKLLPSDYQSTVIEIGELPLYNEEYDANSPEAYEVFRNAVKEQDAIIFSTPEYNRSFSGALKNALDVASRPWGQSVWAGKPALVMSHSISGISGVNAATALKPILSFLDMPLLNQPEIYLANSQNFFDENGNLNNESTKEFLQTAADAFVKHVEKHVG